jgi:hypothetical protein
LRSLICMIDAPVERFQARYNTTVRRMAREKISLLARPNSFTSVS